MAIFRFEIIVTLRNFKNFHIFANKAGIIFIIRNIPKSIAFQAICAFKLPTNHRLVQLFEMSCLNNRLIEKSHMENFLLQ